ncbi:MAG TPA: hypothetical protein VMU50_21945 [Polyangia bacterium]|nr:hypothetical protein [Polyangia bacterium]
MESNAASLETASPLPAPSLARRSSVAEEFEASLEALRQSQELASERARRETWRARLILLGALATACFIIWNVSQRRVPLRAAAPEKTALAAPAAAALPPATGLASAMPVAPAASRVASGPGAEALVPAVVPAASAATAAQAASPAMNSGAAAAECDAAFADGRWPAVASACEVAFAADGKDAALALRIAQAHHRRGQIAVSGEWARKAIALDGELPEAFAILARAETAAGHPHAAATAYRRYLKLAPHGWHAAEARRALRD